MLGFHIAEESKLLKYGINIGPETRRIVILIPYWISGRMNYKDFCTRSICVGYPVDVFELYIRLRPKGLRPRIDFSIGRWTYMLKKSTLCTYEYMQDVGVTF